MAAPVIQGVQLIEMRASNCNHRAVSRPSFEFKSKYTCMGSQNGRVGGYTPDRIEQYQYCLVAHAQGAASCVNSQSFAFQHYARYTVQGSKNRPQMSIVQDYCKLGYSSIQK